MKRKSIETIPPIPLRDENRNFYMIAAAAMEIVGEEHLICDVYKDNDTDPEWILRAAYNAKDWGLWYPQFGKDGWSGAGLRDTNYGDRPVYDHDVYERKGTLYEEWDRTYLDDESKEVIAGFCEKLGVQGYCYRYQQESKPEWHRYITRLEDNIRGEKRARREENRRIAIEERCRNMPQIPDDFKDWADKEVFHEKEYVYYKRRGKNYADCQCSKCGEGYTIRTKRSDSFEGMFEHVEEPPKNMNVTKCPLCGAYAIHKPRGHMNDTYASDRKYAYMLQPYKETGFVVRYFEMEKRWYLGEKSEVREVELGRTFYDSFRTVKTDWHLYDPYSNRNSWYDHNIGGMRNVSMMAGAVYTENWKEWEGTRLQYSALREFAMRIHGVIKPIYYLNFMKDYHLEKLVKLGMTKTVSQLIAGKEGYFGKREKVEDILKIRRCRLAMAAEEDDFDFLMALQFERDNVEKVLEEGNKGRGEWTEDQIRKVCAMEITERSHGILLEYMSITQLINRIERYIGRAINVGRKDTKASETVDTYRDYITTRLAVGLEMERSTAIFPKDLRKAHDEMVLLANAAEVSKKTIELERKFPEIKKKYRTLKARYGYQEGELCVRPAKDVREIIEEGKILHHCVGASDRYIARHAKGESFILFLRKVRDPNRPYITIEISGTTIRQWYGANDKKPDKNIVTDWLKGWIKHLEMPDETTDNAEEMLLTAAG